MVKLFSFIILRKMKKKASDYSKCVIYKIISKDENIKDCYIGHTTNFSVRKSLHKFYSIRKDCKLYQFIKENDGFDNFEMKIIEEFPCENRHQALERERQLIDLNQPSLNYNLPLQTYKELRNKNVEKYNLYMKNYMKEYYKRKKNELLMSQKKEITSDIIIFD